MTMPQTRHYEMKDSGVEWIGKMPSHWEMSKMKRVLRNASIKGHPEAQVLSLYREYGVIPKDSRNDNHNVTSEDTASYKYVEAGDLVINKMKAWQGSLGLSQYEGIVSPAYYVCKVNSMGIVPRYLHHLIRSKTYAQEFERLSTGMRIGQWDLGIDDFLRVPLLLPPFSEQTAIAAYLDEKCATIDAIIAEAKSSIEEYKSWKASVIFETVTKGLNPNAEMKDSGVEWIGKMPKAWQYTPLKYLASCNDEVLTETTPEDYTFDYIDIGSVHTGNGIGICERMQFKDAPSRARRIVRDGDIIVSTVRTYLKAIAQVGNYDVPHIASTGFAVIRTKNANASFLRYALLSDNFVSQVEADSVGISYPAINASQIMAFKIPVPSIAEQVAIASYLDARCAAIDGIIAEKEALISDLETYKKSLIFEVVTGKRRVC